MSFAFLGIIGIVLVAILVVGGIVFVANMSKGEE